MVFLLKLLIFCSFSRAELVISLMMSVRSLPCHTGMATYHQSLCTSMLEEFSFFFEGDLGCELTSDLWHFSLGGGGI